MYNYEFHKKVTKFLKKKDYDFVVRVFKSIKILCQDPYDNNLDIKQLKGKNGCRRLRLGKYRFLYEIQDSKIVIYFYNADSRGDIY